MRQRLLVSAGTLSNSLLRPGAPSPLWPFVENTTKAWPLLLAFNGVLIGGLHYARRGMAAPLIYTAILVGAAFAGSWWYRSHRQSLRAMLLLFQLTGWSFVFSILNVPLGASYLLGSTQYYIHHWIGISIAYVLAALGVSLYNAAPGRAIRQQYAAFRSRCSDGTISADELYAILTVSQRSRHLLPRLALIVGVAVPLLYAAGLTISHSLHRDLREALGFIFIFAASAFVAGILAARLWLQSTNLGSGDLLITD